MFKISFSVNQARWFLQPEMFNQYRGLSKSIPANSQFVIKIPGFTDKRNIFQNEKDVLFILIFFLRNYSLLLRHHYLKIQ